MNQPREEDTYNEEEIARRRDDAIRRALSTPPKPHKEMSGKGKSAEKQRENRDKKNSD